MLTFSQLEWFIPKADMVSGARKGRAYSYVFTHVVCAALTIPLFGFLVAVEGGMNPANMTLLGLAGLFYLMPFAFRHFGHLGVMAFFSAHILWSTVLFGAFHYGGLSSPFTPWLPVAALYAFFYISQRHVLIGLSLLLPFAVFVASFLITGSFHNRIDDHLVAPITILSAIAAHIFVVLMVFYYREIVTEFSAAQQEEERHRATAIALQNAMSEAENASRAKSIFLAKMSHELRTPLNAVIGYSELLMDDVEDPEDEMSKDLTRINEAGHYLLSLVASIMDRPEQQEILEVFNPKRLVEEKVRIIRTVAQKRGNTLVLETNGPEVDIRSDALKIKQCILNLLSNAVKFTHGGRITVTANLTADGARGRFTVSVADTGIGIPAGELESLFDGYQQAKDRGDVEGTGLGLAITRKAIRSLGGDITAESRLGRGSVFTLTVPVEIIAAADRATAKKA